MGIPSISMNTNMEIKATKCFYFIPKNSIRMIVGSQIHYNFQWITIFNLPCCELWLIQWKNKIQSKLNAFLWSTFKWLLHELIDMIQQRVFVSVSVTSQSVRLSGRIAMIKSSKGIVYEMSRKSVFRFSSFVSFRFSTATHYICIANVT